MGPVTRDPMGIYSIRVPIWSKISTHGYIMERTFHPLGTRVWGRSISPHTHLPKGEKLRPKTLARN
jgi:hypothetical protein